MTCKDDCIHYVVCNTLEFEDCACFKNKSDYAEVRHGVWLDVIEEVNNTCAGITFKGFVGYKCSLCGRQEIRKEPYCHCGAKMDGRSDT